MRIRSVRVLQASPTRRALVGTLVGNGPGFLLPFAVAAHIGVGRLTDTYVYALGVATFGVTLCTSVIEPNVLPVAASRIRSGERPFRHFALKTAVEAFFLIIAVQVLIGLIGALALSFRHSWSTSERHLAYLVMLELLLLPAAASVSSTCAGCLYALNDFLVPTATQGMRALLPLLVLAGAPRGPSGIEAIASAVVVGEVLRAAILAQRLSRATLSPGSISSAATVGVWRTAVPAALSVFTLGLNPIIDRGVAAQLAPGSATVIDLGEKIFYVPVTIIGGALVLVSGARWARIVLDSRSGLRGDFVRTVRRGVVFAGVLATVCAALIVVFSLSIGPAIESIPVSKLRMVTILLFAGLPGCTVVMLAGRLLTIARETKLLAYCAILAVLVNLAGDVIGGALIGVPGIAASTALVWTVNGLAGAILVRRRVFAGASSRTDWGKRGPDADQSLDSAPMGPSAGFDMSGTPYSGLSSE